MIRELEILVAVAKDVQQLHTTLKQLNDIVDRAGSSTGLLADVAYVAREVSDTINEVRKEIDRLKDKACADCCALLVQLNAQNVSTELCTATPNPKLSFRYPMKKSDPRWEEFVSLILEKPESIIKHEVMRPHYPAMLEYLGQYAAGDKPMPFGIKLAEFYGSIPDMRIRKKKSIL